MKHCRLFFAGFLTGLSFLAVGQRSFVKINYVSGNTPVVRCATVQKMEELRKIDPAYDNRRALIEKQTQDWIQNHSAQKSGKVVVTIPVVVHVLWRTSAGNVSDARVQEQIDVLNKDYRRLNTDAGNTPSTWQSIAADCELEFCLATEDPSGNTTTGIERRQVTTSNIGSTNQYYQYSQGGLDIWNRNYYCNIWVCEIGGGTLGFTYMPGSPAAYDGVVIDYHYFGKTGTSAPFNLGRTTTHEVGHWFNLYHIWGDDGTSCSGSDYVTDTPNQAGENYGCPGYPHTDACTSSSPGVMFMNYMDYTNDNCMNLFTSGQKTRMWATLNGTRASLKTSPGCTPSGPVAPTANFSASSTTIYEGTCINFTDLSSGTPASWSWSFSGGTPASSTSQNPTSICFNAPGCYDVTLTATNGQGSDGETKTCYINVLVAGTSVCDTISNFGVTDTPVVYILPASFCSNAGWGFVSGHNCYDDRAKADLYTAISGDTVKEAILFFAKAYAGSGSSSVNIRVWDGTSGTPTTVLGTVNIPINQITAGQPKAVAFSPGVKVNGNFFLGVQFSANGSPQDTIALYTNIDGNTSPGTAWEMWNDGSWYDYSDGSNTWGLNVAHAIWVIKCSSGSTVCGTINTSLSATNPSCGSSNGAIAAIPSGGTSPYSYSWSNGSTASSVSGLGSGTYTVIVTDASGCTGSAGQALVNSNAPSITTSSTNASSSTACDGTASVTATGGTPPYTYNWSNGSMGVTTISSLCAGTYTVTVTDANGCQITSSEIISYPTGIFTEEQSSYLDIWPNPSTGYITVNLRFAEKTSLMKIKIYNVIGKAVTETERKNVQGGILNFNLFGEPEGVYFMEVSTDAGKIMKRFSILKE